MIAHLVEPALGRVSGGLRYNAALAAVRPGILRHSAPGRWPDPTGADVAVLHSTLDGLRGPVIIDGLIGSCLPVPIARDEPVVQLVHAPLGSDDPAARERERANLAAATAVVTTSRFAAREIARLYDIEAVAIPPGVDARPAAAGGDGGRLASVGSIEENKNPLFLAEVLAALARTGVTGWHCTFAGPVTDPAYGERLSTALDALPAGSVDLPGELDPVALDGLYRRTDLLLLPSRRETYGMVVAEAAAAGIPAFVTAGTGAEEALTAGRALPLDVARWESALRDWLGDPAARDALREQALAARSGLRTWEDVRLELCTLLGGLS